MEKRSLILRFILLGLLGVSLGVVAYTLVYINVYHISDFVLSLITLIVLSLFIGFEVFLTLRKFRSPLALKNIAFLEHGYVNPIAALASVMLTALGLGFFIPGLVVFFKNSDLTIRSYALIIISIGTYIFLNCVFYYIYVLSFYQKRREKNNKDK